MPKTYRVNPLVRFVNRLMRLLIRWNIVPPQTYLLTVPGRISGNLYSTPLSLVQEDGQRWLVSPYGQFSWVKNARAAGQGKVRQFVFRNLGRRTAPPFCRSIFGWRKSCSLILRSHLTRRWWRLSLKQRATRSF